MSQHIRELFKKSIRGTTGTAIFVFLFVFCVYLVTWQAHVGGYEGETIAAAKALLHGDYEVKRAGIGAVIWYVPPLLFMKLFNISSEAFLTLVPIFFTAATASLLYLCALFFLGNKRAAMTVAVLIAIASVMWPYANIGMEYQAMFLLTLLLYTLLRWQKGEMSILIPSLVNAYLILTKSYGVLFTLPFILFVFYALKQKQELRTLLHRRLLSAIIVPTFAAIGCFLFLNMYMEGSASGAYSLAHEFQILSWWEGFYGIFFSFGKSIFVYSPLLIVALYFYPRWHKEQPVTSIFVLTSFFLLLLITAPFSYWSDETWSVRKLVPVVPLLHLPLVYFFKTKRWAIQRIMFIGIATVAVYVQILGASYYYGKQLTVLYGLNQDSQPSMRFIPEFSHPVVFHKLFMSYLGFGPHTIEYVESSWFRWTRPGGQDVILSQKSIDLPTLHKPDIVWLRLWD